MAARASEQSKGELNRSSVLDSALVHGFTLSQQMVMLAYCSSSVKHRAKGPPTTYHHFILGQMPTAVPCHTDEEARVLVST